MQVRAYTDADLEWLRAMHAAQGFGYAFPDLADPLFLVRCVVEDEGRPRMAALLRLTAEAYLLADPAKARRASAGAGCSRCMKPCGKRPRRAASPTCRRFCLRAFRALSGGGSIVWAGGAIRGPATRGSCDQSQMLGFVVIPNPSRRVRDLLCHIANSRFLVIRAYYRASSTDVTLRSEYADSS